MAVVTGIVKVTIEQHQSGDGSSGLRKTAAAADGVTKSTKAAGASTSGFVSQVQGVKTAIAPLNKTREAFENLRANATLMVGAAVAVGGALITLIKWLDESGTAIEELSDRAKDFEKAGSAMEAGIGALRTKLGQTKDTFGDVFTKGLIGASESLLKVELLTNAAGELESKARGLKEQAEFSVTPLGVRNILLKQADKLLLDANVKRNEARALERDITEFQRLQVDYLKQQNIEVGKQLIGRAVPFAGLALGLGGGKATTFVPGVTAPKPGDPPKPRGGGSAFDAQGYLDSKQTKDRGPGITPGRFAALERNLGERQDETSLFDPYASEAANTNIVASAMADAAAEKRAKMVADINQFSSALTDAIPGMGEFSGALSEISNIWEQWGKTGKGTGSAILGSLGAIGQAGASLIKNDKARAAVRGGLYMLEGAINVLTPGMQALGIAQLVNGAAMIAFGGGGGGAAKGGGRSGGASPGRSFARLGGEQLGQAAIQIVINGGWYGGQSAQENAAALNDRIARVRGTGFGRATG